MDYKTSFKHEGVTYDVEITFREYVKGKLKGFVNASFKKGDEIYLVANDLQVVEGTKGHFISEPKKWNPKQEKEFVQFLIPRDFKNHIVETLKLK